MQAVAYAGLKAVCGEVAEFAARINVVFASEMAEAVSPLVVNGLYQAGKYISWHLREYPHPEKWDMLRVVIDALRNVGRHWAVAGK